MACDQMTASLLPYTPERDVYRLLQVAPTANEQEITAACRRLALAFHPDYNRSPRAHEEMQVVNAVRSLLTDPRSRAVYDGARRRFLYLGERTWAPAGSGAARWHAPRPMGSRSAGLRPAPPRPVPVDVAPFERPRPVIQVLHERARRMGRALIAAVRNALSELGPAHCPTCSQPVQPSDRYCAWCGTWVGRTEKLRGT
jgi:DnaJ domain